LRFNFFKHKTSAAECTSVFLPIFRHTNYKFQFSPLSFDTKFRNGSPQCEKPGPRTRLPACRFRRSDPRAANDNKQDEQNQNDTRRRKDAAAVTSASEAANTAYTVTHAQSSSNVLSSPEISAAFVLTRPQTFAAGFSSYTIPYVQTEPSD